jgi:N-acetylated-alpha-linked acidic dipeptidase
MTRLRSTFIALACPVALFAQDALPGYTAAAAAKERALEASTASHMSADTARVHSRALSHTTHISGTPAQAWTRDYVIAAMKSWGMETEVREYTVWLPHTTVMQVWRVSPDTLALNLAEGPVPQDTTTWTTPEAVIANGYSGTGDVTGQVVYVNYGLIEDYAQLDSMGVSVKGKIAIARYGRSFRGIKAREAEKRGALGLIIYSDPADDGFARGDVYPAGPMRPDHGVQRGSVMNDDGDPSTPGYPSVAGAKRIPLSQMQVPHIPVIPMSYGNATQLLKGLKGANVPAGWQGGLSFRYHAGPGPVAAHLVVQSDTATAAYKKIWDTFGIVRGTDLPDQVVIIGGHRDAWGPGTNDNVSGTVSVMEAARGVMQEVKAGRRPRRTIIFATWDAEEWGLIGSTEYVEDDSLRLLRGGIAYLNQDTPASGEFIGGGGSPSLRPMLRDVMAHTPDPDGTGSVYQVWRRQTKVTDSLQPPMGDPGGGSDFAGFYNHFGIPMADWGFGAAGGVYHSFYDSYHWMTTFGDTSYKYHATAAKLGAMMVWRLANAEILPYDYQEYAKTMHGFMPALDSALVKKGWAAATSLGTAIDNLGRAATAFAGARDSVLARGPVPRDEALKANAALLKVERALTRPAGLKTRPWFRNLIFAADENNGYADIIFPSVREALRSGDRAFTEKETADLASRFDAAAKALNEATSALR